MRRVLCLKVFPKIFWQLLSKGLFLKKRTFLFLMHVGLSFLKGEFFVPDFSKDYPAVFHVNLEKDFRGCGLGRQLIEKYLSFLQGKKIKGVHVNVNSSRASGFFIGAGFQILCRARRSYLQYQFGEVIEFFLLGKKLKGEDAYYVE